MNKICIYCHTRRAITVDHVPPKQLYPKEIRDSLNLITVPCCDECNKSFKNDDDYFRLMSLGAITENNKSAKLIRKKASKSLRHPRSKGLAKHIEKRAEYEIVRSPTGIIYRRQKSFMLESDRIRNTIRRCIQGLFYEETKRPLEKGIQIEIHLTQDLKQNSELYEDYQKNILIHVQGKIKRSVADVFSYSSYFYDDDPNASVWRLLFFEKIEFYGWTGDLGQITKAV